jgi:hypothetical protein
MEVKKFRQKFVILTSTAILLASATAPNAFAFTEAVSTSNASSATVDVKQIKEFANSSMMNGGGNEANITPSQTLAETVAMIAFQSDTTHPYNGTDVLKYLYPNDTNTQLREETITPEQAVKWLNSVGYTADIINRPLTTSEIKTNLNASQPMVTVFTNQNPNYWIEPTVAGILYAHDDVVAGTEKLHQSFVKTFDHQEAFIKDGTEANEFQFSDLANSPDATARNSTFKWTKTITNFRKDPTWFNTQNIRADRKSGVFNTTLTKAGTNITGSDFKDPDVSKLQGMYTPANTQTTLKLAAVSLINLYFDAGHQKKVTDLEAFAKISPSTEVTLKQVEDWYTSLGFVYDTASGKLTKTLTKTIGSSGELYLSTMTAKEANNPVQSYAVVGAGFSDSNFGYTPYWKNLKGEQVSPQYTVDWSKSTAFSDMAQKQKSFNYDTIVKEGYTSGAAPKYYSWNYNANTMIYNIREKAAPKVSDNPIFTTTTNQTGTAVPTTTIPSSYTTAADFGIRETQGQEPWCSEYVTAAAINDVYKAKDSTQSGSGAVTNAKTLMQLYNPGVSNANLEAMGGGTIANSIKLIQAK